MDRNLILDFPTLQAAQTCLAAINEVAAEWWQAQGYTVIEENGVKQLIGKRNGVDAPDATRTITWAQVQTSPDDTYYFTSPVKRYPKWRDYIPDIDLGEEIEFPDEWITPSEIA